MAVGLAGCSQIPGSGSDERDDDASPVAEAFGGGVERPDCAVESETIEVAAGDETRETETATTEPYPDTPREFDENEIVEWVPAFEEAYVSHDVLCGRDEASHVLRITYNTDRIEVFDRAGNGTTIFLRYAGGATAGADENGSVWEADIGYSAVLYVVDDTGAARVELDGLRDPSREEIEAEAPDPVETGDLVAVFG
ncbi:hypothetical protein JCM31271_20810 [Halorubrum trueperi]